MKNKYILSNLFFWIVSLGVVAQDEIFKSYENQKDVTSVYVSAKKIQLFSPSIMDMDGMNLEDKVDLIDGIYILTVSEGETLDAFRRDLNNMLDVDYELLMQVNEEDEQVNFYIIQEKDQISELLMVVDESDSCVMIRIKGRFTLQDIQAITEGVS